MLKKLPKSKNRGTLVSTIKWLIFAEIAAVGLSFYVWRKMCRQQGLLNFEVIVLLHALHFLVPGISAVDLSSVVTLVVHSRQTFISEIPVRPMVTVGH